MKNRYLFFRSIYKEYIIFFIEKKKLKTYDIDTNILSLVKTKDNILQTLDKEQINYIIVDNLDIIESKKYINNSNGLYKKKAKLVKLIYKVVVKEYYNQIDQ